MRSGMEIDGVSVFGNFSGQKINAFPYAVSYCRRMLLLQALENPESPISNDADWERQLDVLLRTDKTSREKIKIHMKEIDQDVLSIYLSTAFEGMLWNEGNGLQDCGKSFVELGSLAPKSVLRGLASRAEELLPAIKSNKVATRFIAAQALGMLAPHPITDSKSLMKTARSMLEAVKEWESAVGAEANKVHGSILSLGYLLSRCVYYGRQSDLDEDLIQNVIWQFLEILGKARDATNKEAVLSAIAQLSAAGLLTAARLNGSYGTADIIKMLSEETKKGSEKAITALGRLAMAFDEEAENFADTPLGTILGDLYGLHEIRQAEVQFTIGEAIACVTACWQSDSLLLALDVDAQYDGRMKRSGLLRKTMEKLLADCKTTKPSLKKAAGIWLFCLVRYCGHLEEVQGQLRECQAAFMGLLSARDDLVQETASRGLSLVYEQGDKDLKDRLVSDLVASFTGTNTKLKVDEETELFEPGALPTGDGQSVTSYKDIMSLAAEVGDQSLVYKFMSLASNAATWSTRAAFGRFGLSTILSESAVDPKLYPKLYRYRFDPNPNVQRSMNDIWAALVKNPTATIEEYFDTIMEDLLKSILGKEWRTREASCAAIADLVQGRRFEKYEKYLSQIWEVAFKVLDDIKGSVRKAAESLCQVMTGILVRQLEEGISSKNAQAGLTEVMPFLFSPRGLESPAKEVQKFAYDTVLKLIKSGGKNLLPFIPSLVEQILGLLSTLEPDFINYIHLNAAKYGTTEEKIDEARSRMVSHSPMMEAIERCLDLADEPTMRLLVPCLENVIKTAVGMPSKVGCSGVLVSLATRHSYVFRPHADIFLKDIERAVLDRNSTVSAVYARASGYVARLASDQQLLKLAAYSKSLYFSAEDETRRQISADIIYAVSKFATDRFNALASDFLPFVFMAKHDFDEHVKDQFEKTWDENVGGSRAVLLYLKEILALSSEYLNSPKWTIKHTAALTIAEVVASAGADISTANAELIWPALEKALALKTFDGKEKTLEAFIKLTKSGKALWERDAAIAAQMKKIVIREAKRNNEAYRSHAFISLGEYAEARIDIDMFDEVFDIIAPRLEELTDEDKMDTTDGKPSSTTAVSKDTAALTAGITALHRAIPIASLKPSPLTHLPPLTHILARVLKSSKATPTTLNAFYQHSKALFTGLGKRTHFQGSNNYQIATEFFALLSVPSGWGAGSEAVRLKRSEAGEAIVLALISGVFGMFEAGKGECKDGMRTTLVNARGEERATAVQTVLERALKTLES
jgi:proteasome component ECM29